MPISPGPAAPETMGERTLPVTGGPPPDLPLAVLLLDDSKADRRMLSRDLDATHLPVEVTAVSTLAEFRAAADQQAYDLALIDYVLPDGDGLEARDILSASRRNAATPVAIISGDAAGNVAQSAMRAGCLAFSAKEDLDPNRLRDLLIRAVRASGVAMEQALADTLRSHRQDILQAMREVLRQELRDLRAPADPSAVADALVAFGLLAAPGDDGSWDQFLNNEEQTFVFRES